MNLLLPLAAVILLCFPASVQAQAPGEVPNDTSFISGVLANGLSYFIQPNRQPEKRAELRLVVRAGSLQEDDDQLGVAHFVEHMAFNGTRHFAQNDLIDYLESVGTRFGPDLNAYTSFGETVYLLQARTDSLALLEQGLLILEDWAAGLSFEPAEIDKERGVVISEWRSRLSSDQRLQQQSFPLLYRGSRYAQRLPIGDPELIDSVPYASIRRYYEDWYRPELMAVVAVGDFDVAWMENELIRRFSSLRNPTAPRPRRAYTIPRRDRVRIGRFTDVEAPFTRIRVVYQQAKHRVKTIDDFRQSLLHTLYNRMLNARLFELQQQQADPPFTFAYSGYSADIGDQDVYVISAFTAEGKALEGLQAVLTETRRAREYGFTASELARQKAELLRSAEQAALESDKVRSDRLAGRLVNHFLEKEPIPSAAQRLELYRSLLPNIGLEAINQLPARWLEEAAPAIIVTGPEKAETPLPERGAILALLEESKDQELEPYEDRVSDGPLLKEVPSEAAGIELTRQYETLNVREYRLENGVRVVLKATNFQNDELLMSAFSPGGHSLYGESDYPSASTAAAIINLSGVGDFSLPELQKKLAGKEVQVSPYIDERYEGIRGSCASDDLETLLQLTYLYFTQARGDSIALASYLSRQRSIVENMYDNPYYYYAALKNRIKYQGHYRRQLSTMEELSRISLDRALTVYRDRFADAGDFTFVFVGNFQESRLLPLIQRYLGNLPADGRNESWKDVEAALKSGRTDTTIVRGQAPKALVEMTYHGSFDYRESQKRYAFYSMLDVLRIKLRESMREDEGGVYGVRLNGNLQQHPQGRYRITLSFNAEPAETRKLIETAHREIENLQSTGPEEAVIGKVRETQLQSRLKAVKENGFWLGQLTARYREQLSLEGMKTEVYRRYLDGLNSEVVREAAASYFNPENYLEIVLQPAPQTVQAEDN